MELKSAVILWHVDGSENCWPSGRNKRL